MYLRISFERALRNIQKNLLLKLHNKTQNKITQK